MTSRLSELDVKQLVELFATICLDQDKAILYSDTARYNRLFKQMASVRDELKRRNHDQRAALGALFSHRNLQVRLQAARSTLAVMPTQARALIEEIADSKQYPHAGDAGMTLVALDRGTFKPD